MKALRIHSAAQDGNRGDRMMRSRIRYLLIAIVVFGGCAERTGEREVVDSGVIVEDTADLAGDLQEDSLAADSVEVEEPVPGPSPTEWTTNMVEATHDVTDAPLLTDVRVVPNEGFDRVVLEFIDEEFPSYRIGYVDAPVLQCGSGDPVTIAGEALLLVRLQPANAHDEQGESTIDDRSVASALPVLREVTLTCDFEAHVEWVLGVASVNPFRVMELAEPARLVIDVQHPGADDSAD